MNKFDLFFNESEKAGSGEYFYNFRGSTNSESSPYEVTFPSGFYLLELWGASGGGSFGGKGGYSVGKIGFYHNTKLYLYVGGQGLTTTHIGDHCLLGGWNGGGLACSNRYQCSGGGGTDVRFTKNDEYLDRIIVAGGGGGAADGDPSPIFEYTGGCGGGLIGCPAYGFLAHLLFEAKNILIPVDFMESEVIALVGANTAGLVAVDYMVVEAGMMLRVVAVAPVLLVPSLMSPIFSMVIRHFQANQQLRQVIWAMVGFE